MKTSKAVDAQASCKWFGLASWVTAVCLLLPSCAEGDSVASTTGKPLGKDAGADVKDSGSKDVLPQESSPGTCAAQTCQLANAECGMAPNACGGTITCGVCPSGSFCGGGGPNQCGNNPCQPKTCAQLGANCGMLSDGCSAALDCGTCPGQQVCGAVTPYKCCAPVCKNKSCGADDGCKNTCKEGISECCTRKCDGKSCGVSDECGGTCEQSNSGCCTPSCSGKQCGDTDGCGGTCDPGDGCETVWLGFVSYAQLAASTNACIKSSDKDKIYCMSGASRYCVNTGWATGFPIGGNSSGINIACVAKGTHKSVPFATITSFHGECIPVDGNADSVLSISCSSACDSYCLSNGFKGGFGPIEIGAGAVSCSCFPDGIITRRDAPSGVLDGCTSSMSGTPCFQLANGFCQGKGDAAGIGPVQASPGLYALLCVLK